MLSLLAMMLTGNIQAQTANDASVRKAKVMKSFFARSGSETAGHEIIEMYYSTTS